MHYIPSPVKPLIVLCKEQNAGSGALKTHSRSIKIQMQKTTTDEISICTQKYFGYASDRKPLHGLNTAYTAVHRAWQFKASTFPAT